MTVEKSFTEQLEEKYATLEGKVRGVNTLFQSIQTDIIWFVEHAPEMSDDQADAFGHRFGAIVDDITTHLDDLLGQLALQEQTLRSELASENEEDSS